MIQEHNPPTNPETIVWKYMKAERFEDMLQPYVHPPELSFDGTEYAGNNKLYLRRVDQFSDPLEGIFPEIMMYRMSSFERRNYERIFVPYYRQTHFVSCWTIRDDENREMWNNYGKTNESIAIKTTYKQLTDSLDDGFSFRTSGIEYVDHYTTQLDGLNPIQALSIKHNSENFLNERELRIIVQEATSGNNSNPTIDNDGSWERPDDKKFILRPFLVDTMINEIVIHPNAPQNFENEVQTMLSTAGLSKTIRRSNLTI